MSDLRVAIVGAGLSGLVAAIELKKHLGLGAKNVTIYEKAVAAGGTWQANTYPGCACDVPSHWYSLSTDTNPYWTEKYSSQPEILAYWKGIYDKNAIVEQTKFDSEFISGVWSDVSSSYTLNFRTTTGTLFTIEADVFISAMGGLSTPLDKPPGMKGIENFAGEVFHSARWNHELPLTGKRVGVIGNGCSASQFVPILAEDKSTTVINFCRTPNYYMPRDQFKYSAFTKWAFANVPGVMKAYRAFIATTSDLRFVAWKLDFAILRHFVEEVSIHHITSNSPEKYHSFLIPKYSMGCKRIILDPGYLQCLHQSNVELITDAIGEITTEGIVTKNGELHDLDVLILATGFDTGVSGIGIDLKGRDGSTVAQQWTKQDGPQAYLGTTIANFPNFYTLLGPNIGTGHASVIYSTESQVNLVVKMIEPMVKYGVKSFECKVDAEIAYNRNLAAKLKKTVWDGGCKSWYKSASGKIVGTFPGTLTELWWKTRSPVWEHYLQVGGSKRVAVADRLSQLFKVALLVASVVAYLAIGHDEIKGQAVIFLLTRVGQAKRMLKNARA